MLSWHLLFHRNFACLCSTPDGAEHKQQQTLNYDWYVSKLCEGHCIVSQYAVVVCDESRTHTGSHLDDDMVAISGAQAFTSVWSRIPCPTSHRVHQRHVASFMCCICLFAEVCCIAHDQGGLQVGAGAGIRWVGLMALLVRGCQRFALLPQTLLLSGS